MVYWLFTGMVTLSSGIEMNAQTVTQQNEPELNENEAVMNAKLYLEIKGMHCQAGCANGIDTMLKEQDGIIKSETSFDRNSAVIEFDPILISEEEIITLITDRGFEVERITEKGDLPKH